MAPSIVLKKAKKNFYKIVECTTLKQWLTAKFIILEVRMASFFENISLKSGWHHFECYIINVQLSSKAKPMSIVFGFFIKFWGIIVGNNIFR